MQASHLKMPYQFSKKSKKIVGTPENAQRLAILSNLLIQSSWRGKYNEVQKWIEQGAHPSVKAKVIKNGAMMTPLIATILGKSLENKNSKDTFVDHFKAFQILIEKGADVDHAVLGISSHCRTSAEATENSHKLISELLTMKLLALHRRATAAGVSDDAMEDAMESADQRAALIDLILKLERQFD